MAAAALSGTCGQHYSILDQQLPCNSEGAASLNLRVVGQYAQSPVVVYILMVKSDRKDHRILFTLEVNEITSEVHALDNSGKILYTAKDGLHSLAETTHVSWPTGEEVGHFKNLCLVTTAGGCTQAMTSLLAHCHQGLQSFSDPSKLRHMHPMFSRYESTVSLIYYPYQYDSAMKVLMAMFTLKLYYAVYRLNAAPFPNPMPLTLPTGPKTYPSEGIMAGIDEALIRVNCERREDTSVYFDILHVCTNRVMMVCRLYKNNSRIELLDEYGTLQFYTELNPECRSHTVYKFDGKYIGSYNTNEDSYTCNNPLLPTMITNRLKRIFTVTSSDRRVKIATLQRLDNATVTRLDISHIALDCCTRAQVMIAAVYLSKLYYKIISEPIPTVSDYQFRKS